jgi:hypothetical protein
MTKIVISFKNVIKNKTIIEKILSNKWPAKIFINNRIAKLKVLIKYEINSIKNNIHAIFAGTPFGKNPQIALNLFCFNAIKKDAKKKVTDKCAGKLINAVIVKVSGIIPITFCHKTNIIITYKNILQGKLYKFELNFVW